MKTNTREIKIATTIIKSNGASNNEINSVYLANSYLDIIYRLKELAERSEKFYLDVMPQIGNICLQDYANMNELGILLQRINHAKENSNQH